jgi:hypothetical protein
MAKISFEIIVALFATGAAGITILCMGFGYEPNWVAVAALASAMFVFYGVFRGSIALISSATAPVSREQCKTRDGSESAQIVVCNFRTRAKRLRFAANVVLGLIVLSLSAGLYIFFSAGKLAAQEQNSSAYGYEAVVEKIKGLLSDRSENRRISLGQYINLSHVMSAVATSSTRPADSTLLEEAKDSLGRFTAASIDGEQSEDGLIRKVTEVLDRNLQTQRNDENSTALHVLISSLATRIGAVLIVLFLVQILITLYRYNVKLAGYCESRADALSIIDDPSEFKQPLSALLALVYPELEFSRAPKTPASQILNVFKSVLVRSEPRGDKIKIEPGVIEERTPFD